MRGKGGKRSHAGHSGRVTRVGTGGRGVRVGPWVGEALRVGEWEPTGTGPPERGGAGHAWGWGPSHFGDAARGSAPRAAVRSGWIGAVTGGSPERGGAHVRVCAGRGWEPTGMGPPSGSVGATRRPERASWSPRGRDTRGSVSRVAPFHTWGPGPPSGRPCDTRVPLVDGREPRRTLPPERPPRVAPRPPLPLLTPLPMALLSLRGHSWAAAAVETAEKNPPGSASPPTPLPDPPSHRPPPPPPGPRRPSGPPHGDGEGMGAAVTRGGGGASRGGLGGGGEVPLFPVRSQFSQYGHRCHQTVPVQPVPSQFKQKCPSSTSTVPVLPVWS